MISSISECDYGFSKEDFIVHVPLIFLQNFFWFGDLFVEEMGRLDEKVFWFRANPERFSIRSGRRGKGDSRHDVEKIVENLVGETE